MKTIWYLLLAGLFAAGAAACGSDPVSPSDGDQPPVVTEDTQQPEAPSDTDGSAEEEAPEAEQEEEPTMEENTFYVRVSGETFAATFADTSGAQALKDLLADGDLTIAMSDYGGFEKVGALGQSLPTENRQTTTEAGDIVLYQGNQIVIFYGSNAWSYTRLGKVDDLTGWTDALGRGNVSVTLSLTAH